MTRQVTPLGDSALIVRVDDSLGAVLAALRQLEAARIPGVLEIAPAFASVAIYLESPNELENVSRAVTSTLQRKEKKCQRIASRQVEIPVCYDREFGLDLARVSEHCRLSPNEIARGHAAAKYHVRCVGFTPGFPYLSGLPDALTTPRLTSPRTAVPAGSVAVGGRQTGIYPLQSPGGWNIIGRTPLRLFDVARTPAALLRVGDHVRFRAITRAQFERWEK